MDNLISIIVPVYNVAGYLDRCMESILAQTYCCLEVLLIDDGSTDGSSRLCDMWAEKDNRVVVFHEKNQGVSMARNMGIARSRGDYLMFVDSDDYLDRDAVRILYDRIIADESDLVIGNGVEVKEDGTLIGDLYVMVEDAKCTQEMICERFQEIPCMVWGKLYRRTVIQDLTFPRLISGEDLWMLYDLVSRCGSVSLCSKRIYYYTQRISSVVHTLDDRKLYDSVSASVYVCKTLADRGCRTASRQFFKIALFRAAEMKELLPARRLFIETFPWFVQIKLLTWNLNNMIRLGALYVPMLHQVLKRRNGDV